MIKRQAIRLASSGYPEIFKAATKKEWEEANASRPSKSSAR